MTSLFDDDINDPYFVMGLDVYFNKGLPSPPEREELFVNAEYFESSLIENKDRVLFHGLPVHIIYRETSHIEEITESVRRGGDWLFLEKGTYLFHRIKKGVVIYARTGWLNDIRLKLENLPNEFWENMAGSQYLRMEHALGDMKAAVLRNDMLFYHNSLAHLLSYFCLTLFACNKEMEPSPRSYMDKLEMLEIYPDAFRTYLTTLLRFDPDLKPERKVEIARNMVKRTFGLKESLFAPKSSEDDT